MKLTIFWDPDLIGQINDFLKSSFDNSLYKLECKEPKNEIEEDDLKFEFNDEDNAELKKDLLARFDEAAKKVRAKLKDKIETDRLARQQKKDLDFSDENAVSLAKVFFKDINWYRYFIDWKEVRKSDYEKYENILNENMKKIEEKFNKFFL